MYICTLSEEGTECECVFERDRRIETKRERKKEIANKERERKRERKSQYEKELLE